MYWEIDFNHILVLTKLILVLYSHIARTGTDSNMPSYSSEKLLLASSCPSVSLSVCMSAVGCHGFPWNLILRTSIKFCREIPNLFQIGQKLRGRGNLHEDISGSYCWRRHKPSTKSFSCNMQHFYIVDSDM
jgi:hypothetical protein